MVEIIRGLVRPFISVAFVSMTAYLVVSGSLEAKEVLTLTGIIVAFHFGERSALKKSE
jgi:hypothetical protein